MSEAASRDDQHFSEDFTGDGDAAATETEAPSLWRWIAQRWWQVGVVALAMVALRVLYILHYRIDSDEPQHLHVVWAWTRGLLPYRDVFDNHAPLFQALCAPLFWVLGVRADIILPMRLAMLPLYLLTILCVTRSVASFATPRVAVWSGALAAFFPPLVVHSKSILLELPSYFLGSIEFRPDQLWTAVWLAMLTVLVCGRPTPRRAFVAGLLLGVDFAVSMKSVLMLGALACAVLHTFLALGEKKGGRRDWSALAKWGGAALLGMVIVPALVVLAFQFLGVGKEFYACVIQHNVTSGDANSHAYRNALSRLVRWVPVVLVGGLLIARSKMPAAAKSRLGLCFFAATYYWAFLWSGWPVLTDEDFLPLLPALGLVIGPLLVWGYDAALRAVGVKSTVTALPLFLVSGAVLMKMQCPCANQTRDKIGLVADTLRLTREDEYVMDSKGETIYRRRPFYYVLERMALGRLKDGQIEDDIIEQLIDKRVPLVTTRRMPKTAVQFMEANYLPIAWRLRVLGQEFLPREYRALGPIVFRVKIPARYSFISAGGPVAGTLDGAGIAGPCEIGAGEHKFAPTGRVDGQIAMVWSAALERGYSPFAPIKKDYTTPQD